MITFTDHLTEERLFDCYTLARTGEALDPPAAEHLADCADCSSRFGELTRFMDALRDAADAEIDEIFPAPRLRQQQQQIARRIEAVGRSARVIHFPAHPVPRPRPGPGARSLPRWVAAAVAAGLFGGVAAGLFFDTSRTRREAVITARAQRPQTPPVRPPAPAVLVVDREDVFFSEIEAAADRPRTEELAAYDALTPHIREVSVSMPVR